MRRPSTWCCVVLVLSMVPISVALAGWPSESEWKTLRGTPKEFVDRFVDCSMTDLKTKVGGQPNDPKLIIDQLLKDAVDKLTFMIPYSGGVPASWLTAPSKIWITAVTAVVGHSGDMVGRWDPGFATLIRDGSGTCAQCTNFLGYCALQGAKWWDKQTGSGTFLKTMEKRLTPVGAFEKEDCSGWNHAAIGYMEGFDPGTYMEFGFVDKAYTITEGPKVVTLVPLVWFGPPIGKTSQLLLDNPRPTKERPDYYRKLVAYYGLAGEHQFSGKERERKVEQISVRNNRASNKASTRIMSGTKIYDLWVGLARKKAVPTKAPTMLGWVQEYGYSNNAFAATAQILALEITMRHWWGMSATPDQGGQVADDGEPVRLYPYVQYQGNK
ncbi:MAG: hypothetical protein HY815_07810 [Candidatus Riflebacteria bacterium]|nr:hypothetical protein [Candidatus Riflebacteria bacterium]